MDEDPRVDPYLSAAALAARRRARRVGARQRRRRRARTAAPSTSTCCTGPTAIGRGHLRQASPRARTARQVPFRSFLEGRIGALDRIPRDFVPGDTPGIFDVAGHRRRDRHLLRVGVRLRGPPARADAGAEVIVVSTNNRSYRRSANSAQHVAIGQMRAAETGRPVVHAAISGISAFIDASGDVNTAETDLFERTVLEGDSRQRQRGETLYVRFGDWIVWRRRCSRSAVCVGVRLVRRRRSSVDSATERRAGRPRAASDPAPSSRHDDLADGDSRMTATHQRPVERAVECVRPRAARRRALYVLEAAPR